MDRNRVLTRNPHTAGRIYDGQANVVSLDRAEVNLINEVGSLVWEKIDGRRTLGEIIAAAVEEYEVTPPEAERDVLEFVDSLVERGIVE